ncbi:MAG TPA: class I lanthipeptide [Frankiaceae bacterium]|nr:class I lanthipeptide [Frankiaceae bacterium]
MTRLTLRRETLAELSADELAAVAGGQPETLSLCAVFPIRTLKPQECITEL